MKSVMWLLVATLGLGAEACFPAQSAGNSPSASSAEPTDAELRASYGDSVAQGVAQLRSKHALALASPKSLEATSAYADALISGLKANYGQITRIDWRKYLRDGADLLAAATADSTGAPEAVADALAKRATFLFTLGDEAGGKQTLNAAYARALTYLTGLGMIALEVADKRVGEAKATCQKTRPLAKSEDETYALLKACFRLNQGEPSEQTLGWASADDRALFHRRQQQDAQNNLARRQAEDAADARAAAEAPPPQFAPMPAPRDKRTDAPHGPKIVSITLHSSCSHSVRVFYGKDPKYGGGRTDTISGNSTQGISMNEGDVLWITDDNQNPISNFSASSASHDVEISSGCASFLAH